MVRQKAIEGLGTTRIGLLRPGGLGGKVRSKRAIDAFLQWCGNHCCVEPIRVFRGDFVESMVLDPSKRRWTRRGARSVPGLDGSYGTKAQQGFGSNRNSDHPSCDPWWLDRISLGRYPGGGLLREASNLVDGVHHLRIYGRRESVVHGAGSLQSDKVETATTTAVHKGADERRLSSLD